MSIHIKKKNEGKFTAASAKRHLSNQQFASKVLSHPGDYSEKMRKRAQFAHNAAQWHHN